MSHQPEIHGTGHGSQASYFIGFLLSIALTIIPYAIVVHHLVSPDTIVAAIIGIGVLQLFVQLYFFLHLSSHPSQRWNLVTFAFTAMLLVFLVAGSLWIMYNMNYNMMEHAN